MRTSEAVHPVESRVSPTDRELAITQAIAHMGSWEWDVRTNAVAWSDELFRIYGFEPQSRPITLDFFLSCVHPDDRERVQREVRGALVAGARFAYPERVVRPDGSVRHLATIGEVARDASGEVTGLIGTCRDVTEEKAARRLQVAEQRLFEMIATGAHLEGILATLVLAIEDHSPPTIACIHLLDATATHLKHGAGPSLPDAYLRAIDGAAIGPRAGSCGTAAFLRRAVYVRDIETDPLWDDYRELAREHGLRACWSTPIFGNDGRVKGTFALYYREPRDATEADRALVGRATHIAGIAIERRQLEDQLRALSAHVESIREDERTGIAREIHDQLGQSLTALKMDLAWIGRRATAETLTKGVLLEKLGETAGMIDEVIAQVRRISAALRPGVLDDLGLPAALEWEAEEFERRSGLLCTVETSAVDLPLDREISTAIFRIFQEALTNVARHAGATHIKVRLERREHELFFEVRDDGKGISEEAARSPKALGLLGVRERVRRLGGTVTIETSTPTGTSLAVLVPLPRATGSAS